MNQSDLPTVRLLARNGAFSFTNHAYMQMLNRDVSFDDVEAILISPTNQIIECQSPSSTPGKEHSDERVLLYDPCGSKDTIIIFVVLLPQLQIFELSRLKMLMRKYGSEKKEYLALSVNRTGNYITLLTQTIF